MKYKSHTIAPVYVTGAEFKVTQDSRLIPRKPTKLDIEYYEVLDDDGWSLGRVYDIVEAKTLIDKFIDIDALDL